MTKLIRNGWEILFHPKFFGVQYQEHNVFTKMVTRGEFPTKIAEIFPEMQ